MLLRNPKEFERVAREWAVIYAGAPKKYLGEGSGGATDESIRKQELRAKEDDERDQLAAYVFPTFRFLFKVASFIR
jgi:ubiquitin-conjugating enzyme (huntingtin interacting protein 2)